MMPVTMHPTRRRFVAWARAANVVQPSRHSPEESEKIG